MPFQAEVQPESIARKHIAFDMQAMVIRSAESSADFRVMTSPTDTQAGYLHEKFVQSVLGILGRFDMEKIADAQGKETIRIRHTDPSVTTGHILQGTANGLAWGAVPNHAHLIADVVALQTTLDGKSNVGHTHAYSTLTGIPSTFAPSAHGHLISDVSNLQTTLDGKSNTGHTHSYSSLTGIPSSFTPSAHGHSIGDVNNLQASLDGKSNVGHTHGWADISGKPSVFAPSAHSHTISDVSGLQTSLDNKSNIGHIHTINDVSLLNESLAGKSNVGHTHSEYVQTSDSRLWDARNPLAHTHNIADVSGLQTALAGKSDTGHNHDDRYAALSHTHFVSSIVGLQTTLDGKSNIGHGHSIAEVANLQTTLDGKSNTGHTHDERYSLLGHTHSYSLLGHTHSEYVNATSGYGTSLIKSGNTLKSITVNPANTLLQISEAFDTIEIGVKITAGNESKFFRGDGTWQNVEGMTTTGIVWANTNIQTGFFQSSDTMRAYFGGSSNPLFNAVVPVVIQGAICYLPAYKP